MNDWAEHDARVRLEVPEYPQSYVDALLARIAELEAELAREEEQAEQVIGMRDATIARLEAENLRHADQCAKDLYLLRRAEAQLAAVIALALDYNSKVVRAVPTYEVIAAATGDTT